MPSITGYTAEKLDEIVEEQVETGAVVGGNLILTKRSGETINAGSVVGPASTVAGPAGPRGPAGDSTSNAVLKMWNYTFDGDTGTTGHDASDLGDGKFLIDDGFGAFTFINVDAAHVNRNADWIALVAAGPGVLILTGPIDGGAAGSQVLPYSSINESNIGLDPDAKFYDVNLAVTMEPSFNTNAAVTVTFQAVKSVT